jgi:aspartyl-tRNA(Asn)/glutamyl-tRNA(Gln) amidotransferase subunit A
MDHVGPIARSVRDLAILLQVIAGPDPLDPDCANTPVPDYTANLRKVGSPPRLGRLRGFFESKAHPAVIRLFDQACDRLRSAGARIEDVALPAAFDEVIPRHRAVMAVEAAVFHEQRLRHHPEDYGPNIRTLLEEGLACPAAEYARCKEHQRQLAQEMRACLEGVDVLLTPATTTPAPDAGSTGDPAFNSPWSYTSLPTVCFPTAMSPDGLPLGVQLVGQPWEEEQLFAAAEWCERAIGYTPGEPPA